MFDFNQLLGYASAIAVIAILIIVHEFGHFLAARYYGFQTPIFGLGLPIGPSVKLFTKWETEFRFYWALIGGFVAIPELGDESEADKLKEEFELKPFKEFPVFERIVVALGGISFNIIFAFLIAIAMAATIGLPTPGVDSVIGKFSSEQSVAKAAGVLPGDKIIRLNETVINKGTDLQKAVKLTSGEHITIVVERKITEEVDAPKASFTYEFDNPGMLGVELGIHKEYRQFDKNPLTWIVEAFNYTLQSLLSMVLSIGFLLVSLLQKIFMVFTPGAETGADLGSVKGIVGIVQLIAEDVQSNYWMLLEFGMMISLNLAVINLLPIPALDGGHVVFLLWEGITGNKVTKDIQENLMNYGTIFLLALMALTTINDIKNLF